MATVPPTMSPVKLRTIADWISIYERFIQRHMRSLAGDASVDEILEITRGKEVQDDLEVWAKHLDRPPMPSIFRDLSPGLVWTFLTTWIVFGVVGLVTGLATASPPLSALGGLVIGTMGMMASWVWIDTMSHPGPPCIGCDE